MMAKVLRPSSTARTISSCPGLKAWKPNTEASKASGKGAGGLVNQIPKSRSMRIIAMITTIGVRSTPDIGGNRRRIGP